MMNVNCVFIFVKSFTLSRLKVERMLLLVYNIYDLHFNLYFDIQCAVPENIFSHPMEDICESLGGGGSYIVKVKF